MTELAFDLVLDGKEIDVAIGAAVAGIEYDLNVDSSAALTVAVRDPSRALWTSPIFDRDENGKLDRLIEVKVDGAKYRLAGMNKAGNALTLTFEDRTVALLRSARGKMKPRSGEDHVKFAKRLVSAVGGAFLTPTGVTGVTETKPTKQKPQRAKADERREKGMPSNAKVTIKGAKATTEQIRNAEVALGIAAELKASDKATLALMVACIVESTMRNLSYGDRDSKGILQLRTGIHGEANATSVEKSVRLFLTKGFWGKGSAMALAKANPSWTAGQVAQNTQGSAFPERYDQVRGEGRALIAAYGGSSASSSSSDDDDEDTTTRPAAVLVQRGTPEDPDETSWAALQRIAQVKGYRCFADRNKIVYAREQDLIESRARATLSEDLPGIDWLDGEWLPGKPINTATASVMASLWALPPGVAVILEDSGPLDGRWLVSSFRRSQSSKKASVELRRGTELLQPEAAQETTASSSSSNTSAAGGDEESRSSSGVASPLKFTTVGGYNGNAHDGADLICAPNAPLYAICDAKVVDVRSGGWWNKNPTGNVSIGDGIIQIECLVNVGPFKKGMIFGYGHAEKATVRVGQTVKAGQRIGSAGFANAWHPHFMCTGSNPGGGRPSGTGDRDPMPFVRYAQKHEKR